MEIYRVTSESEAWKRKAYDSIRVDAFCYGQNIPVEIEFSDDDVEDDFNGILVVDDHKPIAGLKIVYPNENTAKIERVCTVREEQKSGYGRKMISAAEEWIKEKGISHIVISSQDRARGFYEKCGYTYNPDVSPNVYKVQPKKEKKKENKPKVEFHPDFVCVLVEKHI
ncbi:MAG: GNAT family N-acetyltransferase [Clostridia bacterium]|nr:GNAT family N-acetyltransferase [Clostridia bacterium]